MKLQLDENTMGAYLERAINEEVNEIFGLSRASKNAGAAYNWNPNISARANRQARRANKRKLDNDRASVAGPALYSPNFNTRFPTTASDNMYKAEMQRKADAGVRSKSPLTISTELFQRYFNRNCGGNLPEDGIWGPDTEEAYRAWTRGDFKTDGPVPELNEEQLNAYLSRAINEELDELLGSRVRKQSQRMITGKGWGNQKRSSTNGWGAAANSAIDPDADAESQTPQTLVGMIGKLDQALKTAEQVAGVQSPSENLMASVTGAGGVKKSLLAAINALTQIGNRLNKIERMSGSNAIMENAGDNMDVAVGGNAAYANTRNMGAMRTAQNTAIKNADDFIAKDQAARVANGRYGGTLRGQTRNVQPGTKAYTNIETSLKNSPVGQNMQAANTARRTAQADMRTSDAALKGMNIDKTTGYWGRQVANAKNGTSNIKAGVQTIKGAGSYGKTAASKAAGISKNAAKVGRMAKAGQVAKGAGQVAKGAGQMAQWPLTLFSVADEAARQAAQGRQRNIVRTYNAAAILARRLGNIMQEIGNAQQSDAAYDTLEENINEINVSRGMKSFDSIEAGMQELSQLMQQIGGVSQGSTRNQVIQVPEGMDLNTPEGVRAFQEWANSIPVADNTGNPLKVDGVFGTNTNAVYDKIAQMIQQGAQNGRGLVRESKAVETALANLERVAGSTGANGNAYSSINAMSGGADASRLQNAQNIKNIIRTYPPVLNQYLNILADAGADVSALQPLNVDTRPHRNYSVKELQAVDTRIQQLLQIAKTVDIPEGQGGGNTIIKGTLPPKPVRRSNPTPTPKPEVPVPEMPEIEIPEIEDEPINIEDTFMDLDSTLPDIPFMVNPYTLEAYGIIPNDKTGRITKRELKQKIQGAVNQGKLTPERAKELIQQLKQDYKNGVAQQVNNPDGSTAYTTHKAQRAARKRGETDINQPIMESKAKRLDERTFKDLVKEILQEGF